MQVCRQLSRRATLYLLALATASNIGSTATITGNPQNILIGSVSHIAYVDFLAHLGPVAVIGLFLDWGILHFLYLRAASEPVLPGNTAPRFTRPQTHLLFPGIVVLGVLVGFLVGFPPAMVAAVGAAVLLVHPRYPEVCL